VSRIGIREQSIEVWFDHVELYVPAAPSIFGVWACTGNVVYEMPEAVNASRHRMSLWVIDSNLLVGGVSQGWEALLERRENVSMTLEWSNPPSSSASSRWARMRRNSPLLGRTCRRGCPLSQYRGGAGHVSKPATGL